MFQKEELKFPVDWHFRIICESHIDVTDGLVAVLREFGVHAIPSVGNKSSGGKYHSYSVTVTFHDKETMGFMASKFSAVHGVKMVL